MCASDGSLDPGEKDGAGEVPEGARLGCKLDLGAGTLTFYLNGVKHGPGWTGVVGPVKRCVEIYSRGDSFTLVRTEPSFNTDMVLAASNGDADIVQALIAAGAGVNAAGADVNAATSSGDSALIGAAGGGHTEIVQALIAAGADVNVANSSGDSALIGAAGGGHTEIVQALIAAGADVNAANSSCLLYTSPSPRDGLLSRMPSSA